MANARHVVIFTARKVVCAALAIYVVGITLLALLPIATISTTELIIAGACGVALVWLFGRAFESVVIPGERFAYLLTGKFILWIKGWKRGSDFIYEKYGYASILTSKLDFSSKAFSINS